MLGICQARDPVYAAGQRQEGCGLVDNDFEAAFDFLCLDWVRKVLEKKGLTAEALQRFMNLYSDGITIPIINNIPGRRISNTRLSFRQGDHPSVIWLFQDMLEKPPETYRPTELVCTMYRQGSRSCSTTLSCPRPSVPSFKATSTTTLYKGGM